MSSGRAGAHRNVARYFWRIRRPSPRTRFSIRLENLPLRDCGPCGRWQDRPMASPRSTRSQGSDAAVPWHPIYASLTLTAHSPSRRWCLRTVTRFGAAKHEGVPRSELSPQRDVGGSSGIQQRRGPCECGQQAPAAPKTRRKQGLGGIGSRAVDCASSPNRQRGCWRRLLSQGPVLPSHDTFLIALPSVATRPVWHCGRSW
jgi:hypothetical protein